MANQEIQAKIEQLASLQPCEAGKLTGEDLDAMFVMAYAYSSKNPRLKAAAIETANRFGMSRRELKQFTYRS